MGFEPVYNNFATRPATASLRSPAVALHAIIRDQLTVPTWLLLGALIQGLATFFLPYRNIVLVLPVFLILGYKLTNTLLILAGVLENPDMKNVHPYRTGIVLPGEKGLPSDPGNSTVCAIILAVVSNHPLGMFGPGYKETGDRFDAMVRELSADATTHGFLGSSTWLNAAERTTGNQNMTILYFENDEYLHAYAHGPLHSATMVWWRETEEKYKGRLGIMHEVFSCPRKSWEGIYLNYAPTGLGSTTKEVTSETGQKSWASPLVKIKGNQMLYSKGRMGRSFGKNEWEALEALEADAAAA